MCVGVAMPLADLPVDLVERHGLKARVFDRGGSPEVRFLWRAEPSLLPVWYAGRLLVARWGCKGRRGPLPFGPMTRQESIRAGKWVPAAAEPCDVPATYIWAGGVWTRLRHGCRGIVVRDPAAGGEQVCYVACVESTRYFKTMTRELWQPVLIGEVI